MNKLFQSPKFVLYRRYLALKIEYFGLKFANLRLKVRIFALERKVEVLQFRNFILDVIHGNNPFLY